MTWLLSIVVGILATELIGYWVHRLIHSGKIKWMQGFHMVHHLQHYPPGQSQRTDEYISPEHANSVLSGPEWVIPISAVVVPTIVLLAVVGVPWYLLLTGTVGALAYAWVFFSYMHDMMHVKNFWILRNRFLRPWFLRVRRLHDIHHHDLDEQGRMNTNLGICFFGFDRIFGTYKNRMTSGQI